VRRRLPLLALAVAVLLAGWWGGWRPTPSPESPAAVGPEVQLQAFRLDRFTADGRLERRLEGARYHGYRHQDLAEIDAPRLWLPGEIEWRLRGEQATVIHGELLLLRGGVEVERRIGDVRWQAHMPLARLWWRQQRLEGDGPVRLDAPWGEARAGALSADLQRDLWWLEGGVEVRYERMGAG